MADTSSLMDHLKSGKPWLLMVDDDPHMLESTQDILEEMGYRVHTAKSGAETVAQLGREAYNLLLLDFSLPDMSGIQLAEKAKELQPALMVVLMTGHARLDQNLKGHEAAIDEYLTKPVDPPHLMELLQKTLARQRQHLEGS